ncbi:hypothetical protein GWG65_12585 [Bradyrhizobium sp. CSA207]|uniref:recombinase family protein n=1 Tax=Bradyrhizobium sp. CSA207 TaxID=2698826 RepID=UPI0023B128CB|nr:recombinase family protein [Bradyrhizobium sp. CSA207]MDE5442270.1 hypothetical protein [Bradyrhizobium sp. CSA207]
MPHDPAQSVRRCSRLLAGAIHWIGDSTFPRPQRCGLLDRLAREGNGSSGPMGVKSIAKHLNETGIRTRDGGRWGVDAVHKVLTRTTYIGRHRFNTKHWKTRERKPEAEVVEMAVPPIIEAAEFEAVQTLLKTRRTASWPNTSSSGFCSPKRLERILSAVLHRRKERTERRTAHIAELRKRAAEAEAKLKRLYDAIENGIADISDPLLKERVIELKAIRDQARADAERAEGALDRAGPSVTPQALKTFASQARRRMRTESGGYRRDHLRALAQRVEVDSKEIRIMGSKSVLLCTLVAASSAKTAGFGVPGFVPKWRARHDSNV